MEKEHGNSSLHIIVVTDGAVAYKICYTSRFLVILVTYMKQLDY